MEEYEVIEKKILKPTSKTASVSKTSPQLNKADGLSTCNLDSLASVATAELNLKSHITEPQITEAPLPVAEPPATEPAVTESLVTALPVMEEGEMIMHVVRGWDSETSGEKSISRGKPYKLHFLT